MRYFALTVFALHTIAEITFGATNFLTGSSSSLSPEQVENLSGAMVNSYRFLGVALLSLGLLGAAVIFGPGVQSSTAKLVAMILTVFHGLGTIGVFITARSFPELLSTGFAQGALAIHGLLAIGFAITLLRGTYKS